MSSHPLIIPKQELIEHWAPIHYQDVNKNRFNGKADYITAFNHDGDWIANNNWDNMGANYAAFAYTNVSESTTHWFLAYMFFHPRDWLEASFSTSEGEHENDFEAVTMFIRKDGTRFGHLEGMATEAHGKSILFTADPSSIIPRGVTADAVHTISWENAPDSALGSHARPRTYQEAEGHGIYGCGYSGVRTKCDKNNEDGIKYLPAREAGAPSNVAVWTPVNYALRSLNELWEKRTGSGTSEGVAWAASDIYKSPGVNAYQVRGGASGGCGEGLRSCRSDAANMYWGNASYTLARDPAKFMADNFTFTNGLQPPSLIYFKNDLRLNDSGVACRDMTTTGAPMDPSAACDPVCGQAIVNADSFCGQGWWDDVCVALLETVCGSRGVAL